MFSPFLKKIVIDLSLFVAFMLGLFYCREDFLDFLISLFHFGDKVNLSSIAYIIQRAVFVFIPMIMIATKTKFPKYVIIKGMFIAIGVCYLLGNTWVIYYLAHNGFSGESFANLWYGSYPAWLSNDTVEAAKQALYDFQYTNAFVFNYIIWDSYNLFGVIFSFVMSYLYFRFAKRLGGHMRKVCGRYLAVSLFAVITPIAYDAIFQNVFPFSDLWGEKNVLLIFSTVFIYIALRLSSSSRTFWSDIIG